MNCILSKNLELFQLRFPQLFDALNLEKYCENHEEIMPAGCTLVTTKINSPSVKDNGILLHSLYDPIKESEKLLNSVDTEKDALVFYGFGLGYSLDLAAKKFPKKIIVLIEPDINYFLLALNFYDWSKIFAHQNLICLINASSKDVVSVEEKIGIDNCHFISLQNHKAHNLPYFSAVEELTKRNREKKQINENTLEKFSKLWLKNTWKNKELCGKLSGITDLENSAKDKSALVLAAGPSLDQILPKLKELKKKAIIICVDTALSSCLRYGIEPDFIILVDPQYWNARHILGKSSPSSVLITELAAWPSIFRFNCKEIRLISSQYPIGKYLESFCENKGYLSPGGSVATTAWDFARFLGAKNIFMAGLDLGFPHGKTHSQGCQFEQNVLTNSTRNNTIQNYQTNALLGAQPYFAKDYSGNTILTDKRLSLYAWWFESKCASFPEINVYSLTKESLEIPGIKYMEISEFLKLPNQTYSIPKNDFPFEKEKIQVEKLNQGINKLKKSLYEALDIANDGVKTCNKTLNNLISPSQAFTKLEKYDKFFSDSSLKDILSLIFPSQKKLDIEFSKLNQENEILLNINKSKILYELLKNAIETYISLFKKYQ